MHSEARQFWGTIFILAVVTIGYAGYIETGCKLDAVMTWHGKVCAESLK